MPEVISQDTRDFSWNRLSDIGADILNRTTTVQLLKEVNGHAAASVCLLDKMKQLSSGRLTHKSSKNKLVVDGEPMIVMPAPANVM